MWISYCGPVIRHSIQAMCTVFLHKMILGFRRRRKNFLQENIPGIADTQDSHDSRLLRDWFVQLSICEMLHVEDCTWSGNVKTSFGVMKFSLGKLLIPFVDQNIVLRDANQKKSRLWEMWIPFGEQKYVSLETQKYFLWKTKIPSGD